MKQLFIIAFLLVSQVSAAQFSLWGEIRPRTEFRHGYRRMPLPEEKPAGFVYQRTRLHLDYKKDIISTGISIQDVRVWGQSSPKNHEPSSEVHQAWVEVHFSDSLSLKAGRQEVQYDNQRFISVNNWTQPGQKHDLLLLKYLSPLGTVHLGTAFNQPSDLLNQNMGNFGTQYGMNNYKYLNFLWVNSRIGENGTISYLAMADGFENPDSRALYVRGTHSLFTKHQWSKTHFMFNPALQHGKTITGQQIQAWYLRSEITLNGFSGLQNIIGAEFFSGNNASDPDNIYRAFDPSYGTGHGHNGFMDYFTNIPAHTRGAGLLNPFLKNRIKLNNKSLFDFDLHAFWLGNDYVHENNVINRYLGLETDFTFSYTVNEFTQLHAGYSVMFGSPSLEIIRGGDRNEWAQWAFVMLTVKPVFLKSNS
jgi:hypothetical protein